jgi:hypothetical protein
MDHATAIRPFQDGHEHLAAELQWLNVLLVREVARFRASHAATSDGFQGLFIGEDEVDRLLASVTTTGAADSGRATESALLDQLAAEARRLRRHLGERIAATRAHGCSLPLQQLADHFRLSELERLALLVACAPDLDARYETLYAYLQNDVTKRRPTVGLVLSLLAFELREQWILRQRFSPEAPLLRHGLVHLGGDVPFLSRPLQVDDSVLDVVLDAPAVLAPPLRGCATLTDPAATWDSSTSRRT